VTRRPLAAAALAVASLALAACGGMRPVQGRPSGREGWLAYAIHDLRFEAPASWRASGGERRLALEAPDGRARLEVSLSEVTFADERACLAAAEEKLAGQQASLERARRHASRLGGRPAQALEADQGGWHVWAIAACDGGVQYRVFFTAATPAAPEAIDAWRAFTASARVGGEA
jgi:hypothetical protein